jgi:hypothetical protein
MVRKETKDEAELVPQSLYSGKFSQESYSGTRRLPSGDIEAHRLKRAGGSRGGTRPATSARS